MTKHRPGCRLQGDVILATTVGEENMDSSRIGAAAGPQVASRTGGRLSKQGSMSRADCRSPLQSRRLPPLPAFRKCLNC